MSSLPKISIRLDGAMRAADCVALAQAAEKAGFASVWFAENAFARGIMSAATACAVATDRIVINAGVFNPYTRHPAMIAMEIAALADLADGRVGLGLGAGIAAATRRLGLDASKPLPALRDAHSIVRGLLDGQVLSHEGTWFSATEVALEFPPKTHVPIYLAGRGNLTVKFAATASDGLIVSNMCSLVFAGQLAETMAGARSAAGLSADTAVVQYMPCAVDADGDAGRRRARAAVGEMVPRYWALGAKSPAAKEALQAGTVIEDEAFATAADRIRRGDPAADVLDDRFSRAFSLSGTPEECVDMAAAYRTAGVTELALTFSGPGGVDEIAALGEAVARAQPG